MSSSNEQIQSKIRSVLVDRDQDGLTQSKQALESSGMVEICAETSSYALAVSHVDRSRPDFVFCGVDDDPHDAFSFVEKIREKYPLLRVVCIGNSSDSNLILRCFRTGADEYLVKPLQKSALQEMFPRLRIRSSAPAPPATATEPQGKIAAIWGSRGGCGATTLACNLADSLADSSRTILIDLHDKQGDLGLFFDQQSLYSLRDIWGRGDGIDESLVESISIKLENGLHLLLQPMEEDANAWNQEEFERLIRVVRTKYEFIVLDLGHDFEMANRVLAKVDHLFLVVEQTLPSLYLASRKARWLEEMEVDLMKLCVVINAFNTRSSVTQKHITKTLPTPNVITVREDEKNVHSAINQGLTLRQVSRWGKAYKDIVNAAKHLTNKSPKSAARERNVNDLVLQPLLSNNTAMEAMQ
ncbi:MAG: response regulator [Candidatus Omnitrophica bacterium]|nr:response regulator [Candidatus Omnitrophota bacterium]